MIVKFWGVHGSLPQPGPKTLKYGGNTPCVEVCCGSTLLIFDAGSGIRELGKDLLTRFKNRGSIRGHIFLSHYHWDHIQGFPFFGPAFKAGNEFDLYGGYNDGCYLEEALRFQMSKPCFPISIDKLGAKMSFHNVEPGQTVEIDDALVRVAAIDHPGGCMGYRVDFQGKSVIYASDTEPADGIDTKLLELAHDVDVLIHDCMFSPEQYRGELDGISRKSWGHSTVEIPVRLAREANAKQLVLFHHGNEDAAIEEIERKAQQLFPNTIAAYEGLEIEL